MRSDKAVIMIGKSRYEIPIEYKERIKSFLQMLQTETLRGKLCIDEIVVIICAYFNINPKLLKEDSRRGEIVMARRFICHFGKLLTPLDWTEIIQAAGRSNHATAYHHFHEIGDLIEGFTAGDKYYQDKKIYGMYKDLMLEFFKQGLDPNKDYDWKKKASRKEDRETGSIE